MNQSKIIKEGAMLTAIYITLLLIAAFVPVITMIATFLLPVPFVIFAAKHGLKPSVLMFLVAVGLSILFASVFSLPITVLMGIGGIMVGVSIHKKLSAYETWARGTIGFVAGLLFIVVFSQFVFQVNIMSEIDQMINQSLQTSKDLMEQFGLAGQTEEQLELIEQQLGMLTDLIPVIIAFVAILLAFISQWISYKIINRLEKKRLKFPPFRMFRLPVSLVWIYFFSLIFTFFELDTSGTLYLAVNNVLMLTGMLMTLQGFSFIFFYAHHKKMSKAVPIVCVIVTLLIPFLLLYLVRLLGIIDIGFSLRDRLSRDKK
ncbi:YybS family protein [Virgibacillus doumboii]|uniref:YybS family protein n=1 Tax=Virgibacillus doumboii TaxID=2697503 RepID=UPI0013E0A78C|nr:YybS family protein [Virgibacillus doumboii]